MHCIGEHNEQNISDMELLPAKRSHPNLSESVTKFKIMELKSVIMKSLNPEQDCVLYENYTAATCAYLPCLIAKFL